MSWFDRARFDLALLCAAVLISGGCAATVTPTRSALVVENPSAPATAGDERPLRQRAALSCPAMRDGWIELGAFFDELTDLTHLARTSVPYTSAMSSSFDRKSVNVAPGAPEWFANRDFAEPKPGEAVTLLDMPGPGVVTRIWSANPSGTIRIYLDGAETPLVEAPFKSLLTGGVAPFATPYAFEAGGGFNLYFPIPFRKHCRITVTTDSQRLFYHVNHRRYAEGTQLETLSAATLGLADCRRTRTAARLELASNNVFDSSPATEGFELQVVSGQRSERQIVAAPGGSVIREMRIRPSVTDEAALRSAILSFEFDGVRTVQVPLGDFFGTGPGLHDVHSVPVSVDAARGLLVSRWPMPFHERVTMALTGTSEVAFEAAVELVTAPFAWSDDALYFGALWHAPTWITSEPANDWPLIAIRGAGKYVGTLLNVQNGDAQWWGEGDERIFVDGETFPSFFGTGTEDYFGYGWCGNARFTQAFIGQTRTDGRQNWGATSLYRFHVLDAISFRSELRFDLEVRHWRKQPVPLAYDAVGFYYVRPGAIAEPVSSDPNSYRVPQLPAAPPPETPAGPYSCGHG